ncbi:hypothetical protein ALISP_6406 [Alicycliphilus sp. B1]|nr:hypothetical protein ALISP_6406 [Alicycliphilus sp. B1]
MLSTGMALAVVHDDADVLHRVAGDDALGQRLAHALLDRGHELAGDGAALDLVDELEAGAARQRFHAQVHLAELAGAAALLLVAVLRGRTLAYGLAVGDARRPGLDLELVARLQALQQHAQVQLAQAIDHGFVGTGQVFKPEAGVLGHQPAHDFPQALLVAAAPGADGDAVHRHGKRQGPQVDVVVLGGVVQHGVVVQLVDLADRADVARPGARHLHMVLALLQEQVADLEGLAPVAYEQLRARRDGALVHAHEGQLAHIGVDADLEHLGQHMRCRVGPGVDQLGALALALEEVGRVALGRVGQQAGDDVQQFGHAGAAARRDEAHRDQVALAQRLLQRGVQLAGIDVAVIEVALDEVAIHIHHLLYQGAVRVGDAAEVAVPLAVEEAVHHPGRAGIGQVERQAFGAERGLYVNQQGGELDALGVDLVDDDQAVLPALGGVVHHAPRHGLDAGGGVDDDGAGFHRLQRRQALADEVRQTRRIDQVDAAAAVREVHDGGLQRVLGLDLLRVVVAHGAAALHAADRTYGTAGVQQGLGQRGLAGGAGTHQGQGADVRHGAGADGRHGGFLRS